MMCMRRRLYLSAALLWGVPGVVILIKGVKAYTLVASSSLWYLFPVTIAVMIGFFFMFRRIVVRYISRIESLPDSDVSLLNTFPPRGWLLMFFMMGLGMVLKHVPNLSVAFVASFYSGLGSMLLLSAARFGQQGANKRTGQKN